MWAPCSARRAQPQRLRRCPPVPAASPAARALLNERRFRAFSTVIFGSSLLHLDSRKSVGSIQIQPFLFGTMHSLLIVRSQRGRQRARDRNQRCVHCFSLVQWHGLYTTCPAPCVCQASVVWLSCCGMSRTCLLSAAEKGSLHLPSFKFLIF